MWYMMKHVSLVHYLNILLPTFVEMFLLSVYYCSSTNKLQAILIFSFQSVQCESTADSQIDLM